VFVRSQGVDVGCFQYRFPDHAGRADRITFTLEF